MKQKRSKAIDMRFYWVRDRFNQNQFMIYWRPGANNVGDYVSKHHSPAHHQSMRPVFLWNSFAKIILVLTQKIAYRDYIHVWSGGVIIPLWIPPLIGFQWIVRYDLYCSHISKHHPPAHHQSMRPVFWWNSFAKTLLVLTQKIACRDYLHVCSGCVIIPLWIPPLTEFKWLVRYDS